MTVPIAHLRTRALTVPLTRTWGPDVRTLTYIGVEIEDADGMTGHGFSWTPTIGAAAVEALLNTDIAAWAVGRPADPEELWHDLWLHLHEAGGSGVTTIAMGGFDLALWDLRGTRSGRSLSELIGRRRDRVGVYGSGVNLHYPLPELVAQAERWVAAGFSAVKIKVGSPDLAADVERVAAVRAVIGPERRLMLDANQRWDLAAATRAMHALTPFDPAWVEEPLRAEDLHGYRILRSRTDIPLALGENVHTGFRFQEFLDEGVPSWVQPNIVRVGGITPVLDIVARADAAGVPVAPHLLPELSAQLAMTLSSETMIESVDGAAMSELGVLDGPGPIEITGAVARERPHSGLGLALAVAGGAGIASTEAVA